MIRGGGFTLYKLLIADDEPKIRRGLSKMDWDVIGVQVVGEAENGKVALELANEIKPDIMFVDICMPFLSGLDLIMGIKKILPDCIIIIISGHDEFEYAKKAVSLNVFDYILKPVNKKALMETVQNAIATLETHKKNNQYINWAKYQVQKNKHTILQQFLTDWIHGRIGSEKIRNQLNILNINYNKIGLLFLIKPLDIQNGKTVKLEAELLYFCLENILQEIFEEYDQSLTFHDDMNIVAALIPILEKDEILHIEHKIKTMISKYLGREILIGYKIIEEDFFGLPEYYRRLYQQLITNIKHTPIVLLAKCYIEKKYYNQDLSLMEVSEELNVSPAYLSRLIKKETGMTFKEYLTKVRIDKAIDFMHNPTMKLYEIAENVGYSTQHYFSSAFKKITGQSPTVFRQRKDESI